MKEKANTGGRFTLLTVDNVEECPSLRSGPPYVLDQQTEEY